MIRKINKNETEKCAALIRQAFQTVAREFNITEQNCPAHTSFIKPQKLQKQFKAGTQMYVYEENEKIIGYFSLAEKSHGSVELDNLAVSPQHRHNGVGKAMLGFACSAAKAMGANKIVIGIIEENARLKRWYSANGFVHTGTQKFEHLPFTVGFMEYEL